MHKAHRKTSTFGNNSHSYFSDASKALYREQAITRKLKHMQEQNISLQEKIKQQENEIKDQRTVIIYQMDELTRAINHKLNLFEDYKLTREMFSNEDQSHQTLKHLIGKFEAIQKEERIITRVRNNMEKMFEVYSNHRGLIGKIMEEGNSSHRVAQERLSGLIFEKRIEVSNIQEQNTFACQQIKRMKDQIKQFKSQQQQLNNKENELRKLIEKSENLIKEQNNKLEQISKLTEMVVDNKHRFELYDGIKTRRKQLTQVQNLTNRIQLALKEESLKKK